VIQALAPGEPRRLVELAESPLLLTIMAVVHTDKGELPDSRVEVFKACVDTLLLRWHTERTPGAGARSLLESLAAHGVRRINLYQALWEMAYEATLAVERGAGRGGDGRALVGEGILRSSMHRHLGDAALKVFIEYCQSANGLLLFEGKVRRPDAAPDAPPECVYSFPHLHFQEYLTARHLAQLPDFDRRAEDLAARPAWREVVLFLGEHLCYDQDGGNPRLARDLLATLCPAEAPTEDDGWRRVWLAGELLPGLRAVSPGRLNAAKDPIDRRIVERLTELLETGSALAGSVRDRAAAGRTLGRLGDCRPGVGLCPTGATGALLPDISWVAVPGTAEAPRLPGHKDFQTFKLGDGVKREPEYPDADELWPQDQPGIDLPAFYMAVFPVTVAQFRPFMDDGGYGRRQWWTQAGWDWRQTEGVVAPGYWDDPEWTVDNHPVIGVSWHEAMAY